jgi:hypothetical protein
MKNYIEFLNESKDYTQLLEDIEWLKILFSDYKDIIDFYYECEKHIYGKTPTKAEIGIGFCNDTKSQFTPLFKDIAQYLINNDFVLNISELEKGYKTLYFQEHIHKFRKYMEKRPYKKYYYFRTLKKYSYGITELLNAKEKIDYYYKSFKLHKLNTNYDLRINEPADFINVNIVEK